MKLRSLYHTSLIPSVSIPVVEIITETVASVLGSITDLVTPQSQFTAGTYATSVGTITSIELRLNVDEGTVHPAGTVLTGDVLVTNSEGDTETFAIDSVTVSLTAPVSAGALPNVSYVQGTGPQTVDAAADFTGVVATWSVTGPATIDTEGQVTILTDSVLNEAIISVTGTNAAGSDSTAFQATVSVSSALDWIVSSNGNAHTYQTPDVAGTWTQIGTGNTRDLTFDFDTTTDATRFIVFDAADVTDGVPDDGAEGTWLDAASAVSLLTYGTDIVFAVHPDPEVLPDEVSLASRFGEFTAIGAGFAAIVGVADGTYTNFIVSGGSVTPRVSPLPVGVDAETGIEVIADEYSASSIVEAEAAAAHAQAATGTDRSIRLRPYDYRAPPSAILDLSSLDYLTGGGSLYVRPDVGTGPILPRVRLHSSSAIHLQDLHIKDGYVDSSASLLVNVGASTGCSIVSCLLQGSIPFSEANFDTELIGYAQAIGSGNADNSPVDLVISKNTVEDCDVGIQIRGNTLCEGNRMSGILSKFVTILFDASGARVRYNIGTGIYSRGGQRGIVGPNNPNGYSVRVTLDSITGFNLGDTVTVPCEGDPNDQGTITLIDGNDIYVSGMPATGSNYEPEVSGTVTNATTAATATITAGRAYFPNDYGDPHTALVGFTSGEDIDDFEEVGNVWLNGDDRWRQRGDYHGAGLRAGPWDEDNLSRNNTNIIRNGNIYALSKGSIEHYAVKSGELKWNTFVVDKATATLFVTVTETTPFNIGALLTSSSGGSYRILDITGAELQLSGLGGIEIGDTLTDDQGGSGTATTTADTDAEAFISVKEATGSLIASHNIGTIIDDENNAGDFNDPAFNLAAANNHSMPQNIDNDLSGVWFDMNPAVALTAESFEAILTLKSNTALTLGPAPEPGAITSYVTRPQNVGASDFVAGVEAYPVYTKPVSSVASGTAPSMVDIAAGGYIQGPSDMFSGFDGTSLTIAMYIEAPTAGVNTYVMDANGASVRIDISSSGRMFYEVENTAGDKLVGVVFAPLYLPADGPQFVLFTSDFTTGTHLCVRGSNLVGTYSSGFGELRVGDTMRTNQTLFRMGTTNTGSNGQNLRVGMLWVGNEFSDVRDPIVLSRWVAADGTLPSYGADGSTTTGTQPAHYIKGPVANILTNAGTGSDFTSSGTLTDIGGGPVVPTPIVLTNLQYFDMSDHGVLGDVPGFVQALRFRWDNDAARNWLLANEIDTYLALNTSGTYRTRLEQPDGTLDQVDNGDPSGFVLGNYYSVVIAATATRFQVWANGAFGFDRVRTTTGNVEAPIYINNTNGAGNLANTVTLEAIYCANTGADAATVGAALFDGTTFEPTQDMLLGNSVAGLTPVFFENQAADWPTLTGWRDDT